MMVKTGLLPFLLLHLLASATSAGTTASVTSATPDSSFDDWLRIHLSEHDPSVGKGEGANVPEVFHGQWWHKGRYTRVVNYWDGAIGIEDAHYKWKFDSLNEVLDKERIV